MSLTMQIQPLLRKLADFSTEDGFDDFVQEARLEFYDGKIIRRFAVNDGFNDYLFSDHRDEAGRCLIDRFLEGKGHEVSAEERQLLEAMRSSPRRLYRVGEVRESGTATLQRLGGGEELVLANPGDGRPFSSGDVFAGRVVDSGDGPCWLAPPRRLPQKLRELAESLAARDPVTAARLEDPVLLRRVLADLSWENQPPKSRLEAQLRAAMSFDELGLDLEVDDIESQLQSATSADEFLRSLPAITQGSKATLRRAAHAISALWNFTPRVDLGGLSPFERIEIQKRPRLVKPETLPEADRQVWTDDRLAELVATGKPLKALFALCRASIRRDLYQALDLRGAARTALELGDADAAGHALESLRKLRGSPQARELAQIVAERFERLDSIDLAEPALKAIAALDPTSHEELFRGLLQENPADRFDPAEFLQTFAAVGGESCAELILGRSQETKDPYEAAGAVVGLCAMRDATRLKLGLAGSLDRWKNDVDVILSQLSIELPRVLYGELGLHRVGAEIIRRNFSVGESEGLLSRFLRPLTDPLAARRSNLVLTDDRKRYLAELSKNGQMRKLVYELRDFTVEAVKLSTADHPPFIPLGEVLIVLAEEIGDAKRVPHYGKDETEAAAAFILTLLSRALRGRDPVREQVSLRATPTDLLELMTLEAQWADEDSFLVLCEHAPEETLQVLAAAKDGEVSNLATQVLCAKYPDRYLRLQLASKPDSIDFRVLPWVAAWAGDAVLPILADAMSERPDLNIAFAFVTVVEALGTEQARAYLEANLHIFEHPDVLVDLCVQAAQPCGSTVAANRLTDLIREEKVDLSHVYENYLEDTLDLRLDLAVLLSLCEIDLDVEEIIPVESESSGTEADSPGDHEDPGSPWEADGHEHHHEHGEHCAHPAHHHHHEHDDEPVKPIVREAAKVGRNDPCPCGSGKKHKKCCGKA